METTALSRLGQVIELIGTILLASSLAGQERIEHWQAHIKGYLNIRERALRIGRQYRSLFERIFKVVVLPITFVCFVVLFVGAITPEGFPTNIYILLHSSEYPRIMFWLAVFEVILSPFLVFLGFLYVIVLFSTMQEMAAKTGRVVAQIIVILSCLVVLIPSLVTHILIYVLLSPYLLAELISIRLGLRPVLGVLGTLIVLLGLSLQVLA